MHTLQRCLALTLASAGNDKPPGVHACKMLDGFKAEASVCTNDDDSFPCQIRFRDGGEFVELAFHRLPDGKFHAGLWDLRSTRQEKMEG